MKARLLADGVKEFFEKPSKLEDLLHAIRRVLDLEKAAGR
jgi:FixJ family two-component response regulator